MQSHKHYMILTFQDFFFFLIKNKQKVTASFALSYWQHYHNLYCRLHGPKRVLFWKSYLISVTYDFLISNQVTIKKLALFRPPLRKTVSGLWLLCGRNMAFKREKLLLLFLLFLELYTFTNGQHKTQVSFKKVIFISIIYFLLQL